ncbi:helix-turn-helix domain-containing protein [Alicyclobacillus fructus]|uniref:helix-turn-helix domain-containing protein n=1 Tax=Alicyclobacillus fructus TaxID=2816082 RepID=UPI001F1960D7|nr:helix-turn-helix transcriptional regulator [Alicyclobacillus fructus]
MMPTFSERLVALRKQFGLTQKQLAGELGLHVRAVQNYEAGRLPDAEVLIKLAKYFQVSIDYLVGLTDDPTPPRRNSSSEWDP